MKSIKPGRGPSGMELIGSIIAIVFGVLMLIIALNMSGSVNEFSSYGMGFSPVDTAFSIMPIFIVLFIVAAIAGAIYSYRNYKGKDRYSIVDIVDSTEEGDPASISKEESGAQTQTPNPSGNFCTDCGYKLTGEFKFCPGCGRHLSKSE